MREGGCSGRGALVVAALLFGMFLVPLWLARADYLINWDSVQLALGVDSFDLAAHQPHPPGYIGYEVLGRLAAWITGDVPDGLVLLSVLGGALTPAVLFLLARRMLPVRYAVASALLLGFSPLLLHYSRVALTYVPEVALSLPFVLFVHRAREDGRVVDLAAAAVAFAVLGSVRQSAMFMLAPLWLLALRPFHLRERAGATALLVLLCLVWAVPLLRAAGGPAAYAREMAVVADVTVARTAFVTASFAGLLQNVGILIVGLVVGMHATLLVARPVHGRPGGSRGILGDDDRRFLLAWVIVPMLFFVFVHTGQPGYVLLVLPAGYLWVGSSLAEVVRRRRGTGADDRPASARRSHRLPALVGMLSVAGVATFVVLPDLAYRAVSSDLGAGLQQRAGMPSPADRSGARVLETPSQSPLAVAVRQYDVSRNDAYWDGLVDFLRSQPEDGSAVLTTIGGPLISGSFRHVGYYLPGHRVYAVGWDRAGGAFGHLFESRHWNSDYSLRGLEAVSRTLALPEGVRLLIVPDVDVAGLLDTATFETERRPLPGGAFVTLAPLPRGSVLAFSNQGDRAVIRLRRSSPRSRSDARRGPYTDGRGHAPPH